MRTIVGINQSLSESQKKIKWTRLLKALLYFGLHQMDLWREVESVIC